MAIPNYPEILPKPLCDAGEKQSIGVDSDPNALNYTDGWPILYQTPKGAGGRLPQRTGFNAAMNVLSQPLVYWQAGGQPLWTDNLAIAYDIGFEVVASDGVKYRAIQQSGASIVGVGVKDPSGGANADYWEVVNISLYGNPVDTDCIWYVRPDGDDDAAKVLLGADPYASENIADKAFKTMSVAYDFFASTYFLTKLGTITFVFGAPGAYIESNWVRQTPISQISLSVLPFQATPAKARVAIRGDITNKSAYIWVFQSTGQEAGSDAVILGDVSLEGVYLRSESTIAYGGVSGVSRLLHGILESNCAASILVRSSMIILGECAAHGYGICDRIFELSESSLTIGDSPKTPGYPTELEVRTANTMVNGVFFAYSGAIMTWWNSNTTIVGNKGTDPLQGYKYIFRAFSELKSYGRLASMPGTQNGIIEGYSIAG